MISITEELFSYKIRKGKENLYLKGKNKGQTSSDFQMLAILKFEIVMCLLEPAKISSRNILFFVHFCISSTFFIMESCKRLKSCQNNLMHPLVPIAQIQQSQTHG